MKLTHKILEMETSKYSNCLLLFLKYSKYDANFLSYFLIREDNNTMEKIFQEILELIKFADKRIIIGISGHGAAGKTTFAQKLIHALDQDEVNYMNTDPYIVDSDIRKQTMLDYTYQNEHHRFKMTACHPAAHHLPSLERDVQMIRAGLDLMTIDTHYMKSTLISSKTDHHSRRNVCSIYRSGVIRFKDLFLYGWGYRA